jgi:hypothetical protein
MQRNSPACGGQANAARTRLSDPGRAVAPTSTVRPNSNKRLATRLRPRPDARCSHYRRAPAIRTDVISGSVRRVSAFLGRPLGSDRSQFSDQSDVHKKEGQPTGGLLKNTERCAVLCATFLFKLMNASEHRQLATLRRHGPDPRPRSSPSVPCPQGSGPFYGIACYGQMW